MLIKFLWLPLLTDLVSPSFKKSCIISNYQYSYVKKTSDPRIYSIKTRQSLDRPSEVVSIFKTKICVTVFQRRVLSFHDENSRCFQHTRGIRYIQATAPLPTTFYLQTTAIHWCGVKYIYFLIANNYKDQGTGEPWLTICSGNSRWRHTREPQKLPIVWYSIYRPWLAK